MPRIRRTVAQRKLVCGAIQEELQANHPMTITELQKSLIARTDISPPIRNTAAGHVNVREYALAMVRKGSLPREWLAIKSIGPGERLSDAEQDLVVAAIYADFKRAQPQSVATAHSSLARREDLPMISDSIRGYNLVKYYMHQLINDGIMPKEWYLPDTRGGRRNVFPITAKPRPKAPPMGAPAFPVPFALGQPDSITVWRDNRPVINVPGAEGLSATFPEGSKPAPVRASPGSTRHGRSCSTSESAG